MNEDEISGVLILHKPQGMTSHDCVNKIRRFYHTKKVGHTGTLDPLATGVLPILIGRAAKAADFLTAEDKIYVAGLRLGLTTDTEDITGKTLSESSQIPDETAVYSVCNEFVGKILQIPPMYSALKINGQKLVDLARRGVTVEREARPITVYSLQAEKTELPTDYRLTVHCSKGTYIRTLCADIGAKLGCGGVMSSLTRTKTGAFSLNGALTLEQMESMTDEERLLQLKPVENLFADYATVVLPPFFEKLSKSGCEIYQKKIGIGYAVGTRLRIAGADGFFAVGEVEDFPDGTAIRILKRFVL